MSNVPDWLWQGMAIWATGKSIELAWKHRRVLYSKTVQLSGVAEGKSGAGATLRVVKV